MKIKLCYIYLSLMMRLHSWKKYAMIYMIFSDDFVVYKYSATDNQKSTLQEESEKVKDKAFHMWFVFLH